MATRKEDSAVGLRGEYFLKDAQLAKYKETALRHGMLVRILADTVGVLIAINLRREIGGDQGLQIMNLTQVTELVSRNKAMELTNTSYESMMKEYAESKVADTVNGRAAIIKRLANSKLYLAPYGFIGSGLGDSDHLGSKQLATASMGYCPPVDTVIAEMITLTWNPEAKKRSLEIDKLYGKVLQEASQQFGIEPGSSPVSRLPLSLWTALKAMYYGHYRESENPGPAEVVIRGWSSNKEPVPVGHPEPPGSHPLTKLMETTFNDTTSYEQALKRYIMGSPAEPKSDAFHRWAYVSHMLVHAVGAMLQVRFCFMSNPFKLLSVANSWNNIIYDFGDIVHSMLAQHAYREMIDNTAQRLLCSGYLAKQSCMRDRLDIIVYIRTMVAMDVLKITKGQDALATREDVDAHFKLYACPPDDVKTRASRCAATGMISGEEQASRAAIDYFLSHLSENIGSENKSHADCYAEMKKSADKYFPDITSNTTERIMQRGSIFETQLGTIKKRVNQLRTFEEQRTQTLSAARELSVPVL